MNGGLTGPSAGSAQLFPNGVFSNLYLSSDLNGDNILDPGWIMLGKYQDGGFNPEKVGGLDIVWSSFFNCSIDFILYLMPNIANHKAIKVPDKKYCLKSNQYKTNLQSRI